MSIKIVALGDSITNGTVGGVVPRYLTWTFILKRILNSWLDEKVVLVNAGVDGDTTVGALKRLDRDVISQSPDIVLIMFGMNDCLAISLEQYRKNLVKIISIARRNNIQPILMTSNPVTRNYLNLVNFKDFLMRFIELKRFTNVVREVAVEKEVPLIDIDRLFEGNSRLQDFVFDGIHPDGTVSSSIASFIASHLLKYLGITNFPYIELIDYIKVYEDGRHNAFTDMIEYKGNYYIAFRNASSHFNPEKADGKIFIMKSNDLSKWDKIYELHIDGWDNRDPKLYVFNEKLYLFTQSWNPKQKVHKTFMFYTDSGVNWKGPYDCGEYVYWRPRYFAGYTYAVAYKKWRIDLLKSKNCIDWKLVRTMYDGDRVNETDILFNNNSAIAFARREGMNTLLLESRYPFNSWSSKELNEMVQSPAILNISGKIFLAGRYVSKSSDIQSKTAIFLYNDKLKLVYELPSGGDNAYPGVIKVFNNLIAISYYSSHETNKKNNSNIYLALLSLKR